jgi:putative redox protein
MTASNIRQVRLDWTGEGLAFRGGKEGGVEVGVDSSGEIGPSPMELLLLSVAGCMAIDILMILEKSRVPVEKLWFDAIGTRAETMPKRYTAITLVCHVTGPSEDDESKVTRAVDLSRDKYCSVLHTLDPAIEFDTQIEHG